MITLEHDNNDIKQYSKHVGSCAYYCSVTGQTLPVIKPSQKILKWKLIAVSWNVTCTR